MEYKVIRHKDEEREDHKYIARVKVKSSNSKKNKWRYFYTMPEYKAYLNGQKKTSEASSKKKSLSDMVKGLFVKKKTDSKPKSETSKKLTNEPKTAKKTTIKNLISKGKAAAKKAVKKVDKATDKAVTKGKAAVEKFVKTADKKVDEVAAKGKKLSDKTKQKVDKLFDKLTDKTSKLSQTSITKKGEQFVNSKEDKKSAELTLVLPADTVKQIAEFVGEIIETVADKIGETVDELFNKDKSIVDEEPTDEKYNVQLPNGKYKIFDSKDEYEDYMERLEYQKNEPDFMKHIADIDPNTIFTRFEDQEKINELFIPNDFSTAMNCANCSAAYELRRRGYDVEAILREGENDGYNGQFDRVYDYFENAEIINVYGNGKTETSDEGFMRGLYTDQGVSYKDCMTKYRKDYDFWENDQSYTSKSIEKAITNNNPPGSRGFIDVEWKNSDSGHSIVYEVDTKGKVIIRDSQSWDEYSVDELASKVSKIRITRTDNLELKEEILHAVKTNEDKKREWYADQGYAWAYERK